MGIFDNNEYFESKQFNDFLEYKSFPAEKYNTFELTKTSNEISLINEQFYDNNNNLEEQEKNKKENNESFR